MAERPQLPLLLVLKNSIKLKKPNLWKAFSQAKRTDYLIQSKMNDKMYNL